MSNPITPHDDILAIITDLRDRVEALEGKPKTFEANLLEAILPVSEPKE